MEGDYHYGNARIRAMKSRLLDTRAYKDLLAAAGIDEVTELLAGTAYKAEIEATLVKYGGIRCVAEAVRINVARTAGKIKTFFGGRPRELVGMLLARWDIFNLVTILRGQARGVPADEILDTLIPAGEFTEIDLREMAQQPSMHAIADLMVAWRLPYGASLRDALRGGGELSGVEMRLNQLCYQVSLANLASASSDLLVTEMLEAEIDAVNLLTLLRLCRLRERGAPSQGRYARPDAMPLLIDGGTLSGRRLEELGAATDIESIVRGLSGTPYAKILSSRLESYRQSGDLTALQRGLEEFLVRKGIGMFHRDPLTIAIPIGYIWAKTNEVANVRLIAQGKKLGLDQEAVRKELIW